MVAKEHYHLAIDFDGPIHAYSKGFHDGTIYDRMSDGFREFYTAMQARGMRMIVFTCRDATKTAEWLAAQGIMGLAVTNVKPIANVYIDDRAYHWTKWGLATAFDIGAIEARGERGFMGN